MARPKKPGQLVDSLNSLEELPEESQQVMLKDPIVMRDIAFGLARNHDGQWTVYQIPYNALTGDVGKLEVVQIEGDKSSAEDRFRIEAGKRLF